MRTPALIFALLLVASPALAQNDTQAPAVAPVTVSPAEGNWGCIAMMDNTKAGLLTIFAGSYGYASANFGSAASGTGDAQMGSDGAKFLNGSLATIGITTALASFDANGADVLTLYNPEKAVLTCTPR